MTTEASILLPMIWYTLTLSTYIRIAVTGDVDVADAAKWIGEPIADPDTGD